jgi:N6-L-threonylcarbamoyladenine synthase
VWIDQAAQGGNPKAFDFPRALPQKATLDFSFSGLKTAVSLQIQKLEKENQLETRLKDLCASIQEAIVEGLWKKIALAIERYECKSLAIVGGVAANSRLRALLQTEADVPVFFPLSQYCTDNGAMIAAAGAFRFQQGRFLERSNMLNLNAHASPEI